MLKWLQENYGSRTSRKLLLWTIIDGKKKHLDWLREEVKKLRKEDASVSKAV
jgi:hypothetical protein